jgi:hypothetical protein
MIGASSPLVQGTLRRRALNGSEPEEMAIWFGGGEDARARFEIVIVVEADGEAFRCGLHCWVIDLFVENVNIHS